VGRAALDGLGDRAARRRLTRSYPSWVAVDEVLLVLVFAWFGIHVSFPRGSQVSRFAGVVLALTFLEMVVWFATHEGAVP
jgi:type VI protein secretion system component VasF